MADMYRDSLSEASIEDVLSAGEKILWKGFPKKSAFVAEAFLKMLPIAILWLVFDGAFIATMISTGAFSQVPWLLWVIIPFFLLHLTPVWIWLSNILKASKGHKNVEYAVTDRRILEKSGISGINFKSIYYSEAVSVNVKISLTDKMLHVGDIVIKGQAAAITVCDQEQVYDVFKLIQQCVADGRYEGKKPVKCAYCGAAAEAGTLRCPNCNAILSEDNADVR